MARRQLRISLQGLWRSLEFQSSPDLRRQLRIILQMLWRSLEFRISPKLRRQLRIILQGLRRSLEFRICRMQTAGTTLTSNSDAQLMSSHMLRWLPQDWPKDLKKGSQAPIQTGPGTLLSHKTLH